MVKRLQEEDLPIIAKFFEDFEEDFPRLWLVNFKFLNAFSTPIGIFVSKELIENLSNEKIFAILLHEKGHLKGLKNLFTYIFSLIAFGTYGTLFFEYLLTTSRVWIQVLSGKGGLFLLAIKFTTLLILIRLGSFPVTYILHLREYQADRYATKILGKKKEWLVQALMALKKMGMKKLFKKLKNKNFSTLLITLQLTVIYFFIWPMATHPEKEKRIRKINER